MLTTEMLHDSSLLIRQAKFVWSTNYKQDYKCLNILNALLILYALSSIIDIDLRMNEGLN